ncbi:MAG TPA: hypothetical protein VFW17_01650 [Ktedonobacterales bacterium]|nr:hypothetical protein [Ktedonobacterales bacterium]
MTTQQTVRAFLLIEAVAFLVAGAIHSGMFVAIDTHYQAATAESIIGVVLLVSFGLTWVWSSQARLIGLLAQAFAAFGTMVGLFTIAVGVGPRSVGDIAFHLAVLAVLGWGIVVTARSGDIRGMRA